MLGKKNLVRPEIKREGVHKKGKKKKRGAPTREKVTGNREKSGGRKSPILTDTAVV